MRAGRVDDVLMRITDIQLAIPTILLAIAVVAVLGPGLGNVILTLSVTGWTLYARLVRGETLRREGPRLRPGGARRGRG